MNRFLKSYDEKNCIKCKKYKKCKKPKTSHICQKTLLLSSICNKCGSQYLWKKIFTEQEPIEMLKILGLIDNIEKYQIL